MRRNKPIPPSNRKTYNGFHIFHKWKVVDEQPLHKYLECEKCGKRKIVESHRTWQGYQPMKYPDWEDK